jgi:hypothetical protein
MKYSPMGHLIEKILKGDVSDNIKPCLFNKKWVYELVPGMTKKGTINDNLFIKSNKKIIDYYISNPDQLEKDFNNITCNGEEYIQGYLDNKKIIAFSELPNEYVLDVHRMFDQL